MTLMIFALACALPSPGPLPPDATNVQRRAVPDDEGGTVEVITFEREAPSEPTAVEIEAGCEGGDLDACWAVGDLRQYNSDYAAADAVWSLNCDRGHGRSCADIANLLTNSGVDHGAEVDAPGWAKKACDLDNGFGCYMLGGWTRDGKYGLRGDAAAARPLFERGCALEHHWACEAVDSQHSQGR